MTRFTTTARPLALLAAAGLFAAAASPAMARTGKGPATITLSAKTAQDGASRLCMPKTTLGSKAERSMPDTICQTRAEWEAAGVTFKVK
ncbi:MAG: hypothetical protein PGN08_03410 [Sphingomonas taxi]